MDHTLALIILPMLKQFKLLNNGVPGDFSVTNHDQFVFDFIDKDSEMDEAVYQWEKAIDKMIWSFEQLSRDDWPHYEPPPGYPGDTKAYMADVQNGLDLFSKHYMALWI